MNISFAGCGFLGIYHVGVASCIKEYAPHLLVNKISGASIGALSGSALLCDVSLGEFTSNMLGVIYELRRRTLGPFNPLVNVNKMLMEIMLQTLPEDAYKRCSGKLHISMTRVSDGANVIVSEFKSNDELLQALLASAFVPIFSGFIPPKYGEHRYIDGGFSNNLPTLDENTITVSPFCGESDICPRDSSLQLFHVNLSNTSIELSKPNIYRFARILFPPSPEVLSMMCKQGFEDALKFLQRNHMISCTKCLAVQTTLPLPVVKYERRIIDQSDTYDPECEECVKHRQKAAVSNLPEIVVMNFEQAIEKANKGIVNWIFRHRGMKIVSIIGLPYILGLDVIRAILKKFVEMSPDVIENAMTLSKYLVNTLVNTLARMNETGRVISSAVFGHLEVSVNMGDGTTSRVRETPSHKAAYNFAIEPFKLEKIDEIETTKNGEPTVSIYPTDVGVSDDTYEHILEVMEHHDSLMAFYYMDEHNKMKLMEFFDVTDNQQLMNDSSLNNNEVIDVSSIDNESIIESWTMGSDDSLATSYVTPSFLKEEEEAPQISKFLDDVRDVSSDPESDWVKSEDIVPKNKIVNDSHRSDEKRSQLWNSSSTLIIH